MPFLLRLLDGATIRARVHRVILAGLVARQSRRPHQSCSIIPWWAKKKRASEWGLGGWEGEGGTRQKGGTRWVVINGEAIWFLLDDVLFALRGGLRRHNEQAPVLMKLHSFVDHNRLVCISYSWQSEALIYDARRDLIAALEIVWIHSQK